jgi:hypothetical protein
MIQIIWNILKSELLKLSMIQIKRNNWVSQLPALLRLERGAVKFARSFLKGQDFNNVALLPNP